MSAPGTTSDKLVSDSEYYIATLNVYHKVSSDRALMYNWIGNKLPALHVGSIGATPPIPDGVMRVLSIGAGDGDLDSRILMKLRQREQLHIQAVILEPDPLMIERYAALASKESDMLQGISFEFRQETLEEFQKKSPEGDKFHFISSISSVYYLEDKEKSVRYLYDKLDAGGVLLVAVMSEAGGFGKFWQYHRKFGRSLSKDDFYTSSDVKKACKNKNIPVSEIQDLKSSLNITPFFEKPLHQLSEEGNMLLDFLTHTIGFAKNAPAEYGEAVLQFLGSEACSVRDSSGQVLFNTDYKVFIIRAQSSTQI